MPAPFKWMKRLPDIRRSVSNSQRSHYDRRELKVLLGTSDRAAGRVLELIATNKIADAHVVTKEKLQWFLEGVADAEDVPAFCRKIVADRENLTRVKARHLCLRDVPEVPFSSLRRTIVIEPGHRLEIRFNRMEDLCEQLLLLARAMQDDPLAFEQACEAPRTEEAETPEAADARWIREETARLDELIARRKQSAA